MTGKTVTKTKTGLWSALAWLAAVVLLIWGISIGQHHPAAAVMLIVASLMTLPPVQQQTRAKLSSKTPGWSVVLLPIALAVGGIGLSAIPNATDIEEAKDPVANVVRYQALHIGATQSCKEGFQAVSDEARSASPDLQRMYDLASTTQERCRAARSVLRSMDTPKGLNAEEGSRFFAASRTCDFAYLFAEQTADKLKEALDGGMAPSKVAAFRDSANEAVAARHSCETQIAEAAEQAVAAHGTPLPSA